MVIYNNILILTKNKNNIIIESQYHDGFEKMKQIYTKDENLMPFIEQINVISHIYINKKDHNKNIIHIGMSLDNKYAFIILVSMESILINCKKNETFIKFHLLCNPDVKDASILKIKSLIYKYSSNTELTFYSMGNNFKEKKNFRSQATYYRLLLPIFIDSDRIIYLDGDTLTLKDLTEMYYSNFYNNYVLGFLGIASSGLDYLGIKANNWINAGVLLLNLKQIREDNKCFDLLNITKNGVNLKNDDNTVINYAFYPKIGKLPIKYGIFNFYDKHDIERYSKFLRQKINISEYEETLKDPGLIHNILCLPKVWYNNSNYIKQWTYCEKRNNCSCEKFHKLWHYYAKKSILYYEILDNLNKIFKYALKKIYFK